MKSFFNSLTFILITDGIIFLFCGLGILQSAAKVDLPLQLKSSGNSLIISQVFEKNSKLKPGDTLYTIDGQKFTSREEVEVYLDGVHNGQLVNVSYIHSGIKSEINLKPIKFYSAFYTLTVSFSSLLFFLIGIFVLIKSHDSEVPGIFHRVVISTAVIMTTTWGNYNFSPMGLGFFLRFLFSISYTLAPVSFLHFALIFPRKKKFDGKFLTLFYLIALALGLISFMYFLIAAENRKVAAIQSYLFLFELCRALIAVSIVAGIIIFVHSYLMANEEPEKKKLRWVLFGLIIGPLMFAFLWVIPQAFTSYGLVSEELVIILMLAVPITFAIAILKYHLLDIDLIIKRSIIYSVVVSGLLLIYISLIYTVTNLVKDISEYTIGSISAVLVALLFQPAKLKVQKIVDKKFFKVQYDFREALKIFLNGVKDSNTKEGLAEKIVEETNKLLPVIKIGFFLFDEKRSRISLASHKNFNLLEGRSVYLNQRQIKTDLSLPVALPEKIEGSVEIETADNHVFHRWGIALVLPMKSVSGNILGFLVLGEKKSGLKFSIEDVDLLLEVTLQAGLALERILAQEELIREQLLKAKLEELNKLKSFFISTVSHELKTPLTSIKMFSDVLQAKSNLKDAESEEYLEIISGECDRLGRLIENVLDLSKIERGVKEYHFAEIDIKALVCRALELMSYQFKIEKCDVEDNFTKDECSICGDSDAVMSAVINLLANGIKYSTEPKKINISLERCEGNVVVAFASNGPALSKDEIRFITEPYFRTEEVKRRNIPGSGIGLSLVNQIMEAHKGKLEIQSDASKGNIFILKFPMENKDETNFNN